MKLLTKQQKIDVSQNLRGAISNLTMAMESMALNERINTNSLENIKYQIDEAIMHIKNGE